MKLITYSRVGYNHPSQANWSWGIFKVDLIDTKYSYNMAYTVKENFGGDSRFRSAIQDDCDTCGVFLSESKGTYPPPEVTGVSSMQIMESDEFIKIIKDWINQ